MTNRSALPDFPGLAGCAAALAAVCALAWASLATTELPPPAGAGAPAEAFSAGRAAVHLQALARTPRPVASSMNEDARCYIVGQLRAIGLQTEVQVATAVRQSMDSFHNVHVTLAVVHNIVARKPGVALDHASRPALMLASHYDSGAGTLDASGAASAAAMLETARALQAGPPLANDVVLLFADGDQPGAMGEQAFAEQHRLARHIGLTLHFRHLGNAGPVVLQRAHGNAGAAIKAWADGTPRGSSLVSEAAGLMPDARGIGPLGTLAAPLMQFGAVEGQLGRFDTPDRFAPATLQQEGDTMLSMSREMGTRPLERAAAGGDQVYFTLPAVGMVHYPARFTWTIAAIAMLLLACVCAAAVEGGWVDLADIARGAFGYAFVAGAPLAVLYLDGLHGAFSHMVAPDAAGRSGVHYVQGIALLIAGLFIWGQRWLCARIGVLAAALGALAWLAGGLAVACWLAPGASYLFAWPVLGATVALAAQLSPRVQALPGPVRWTILLAGALPAVALALPAARDTFAMLTPFRIHIPLWLLSLALGAGVALLGVGARRFTVRAAVLAGAALLAIPGSASSRGAIPPGPNPLVYYKHMPTWSEWWLSHQPQPDDWTRKLFAHQARPVKLVDVLGWGSREVWYAKAPRNAVAFPYAIQLVNDDQPSRHIVFDLTSKNRAPHIELSVGNGKPWRAAMNGRVLSDDPQIRNWSLSLYGMQDQPMHFDLNVFGEIVAVNVEEHIPGLPAASLPVPEPAGAYIPMTGQTIATDQLWFR